MKSLSDQLVSTGIVARAAEESLKERQAQSTRPRCMCHNVYLSKCPNELKNKPWDCRCGTTANSPGRTRCRICGTVRGKK
jgi:hypothetical protein